MSAAIVDDRRRARSFVFANDVRREDVRDGEFDLRRAFDATLGAATIRVYWNGRLRGDGKLERSSHRADAYKFNNSHAALLCAETHDELRDSTDWKIVPLFEGKRA